MPPVVVGVVVAAVAYTSVSFVVAVGIGMAAAALYSVATMKMPSAPGVDPQSAKQTIRSPNEPFRGIYGNYVGSGPLIFAEEFVHKAKREEEYQYCTYVPDEDRGRVRVCETRKRWVDESVKWLHLVIPLAGHPVFAIEEVYFNDELQSDWDASHWRIHALDGTQRTIQDLPALLREVPSWQDNMVGKGVAFLHVALRHSATYFPNGIPNIKAKVKGKVVETPFFSGFTNNAAAVIYDYLRYHFKVPEKNIDTASFANEYNISAEVMPGETYNGEQKTRYTIDGGFSYDEPHQNVIKKMKTACGASLDHIHGKYYLSVAAYRGPVPDTQQISMDDVIGAVTITTDTPLSERINKVTGQFLDSEREYQLVDFKPVTEPQYVEADGEERVLDMNLEYVTSPYQAQRLAKIALKDNRFGLVLEVPMNWRGFGYNVGLPVRFNDSRLGYDSLEFKIITWRFSPDSGLVLVLKQTSADIFDDAVSIVDPKPIAPNLPDPRFVAAVEDLQFDSFPSDNNYNGILLWSHPDPASVRGFNITVTSSSGEVIRGATTEAMEYRLSNLQGITYTLTVTAVGTYGSQSEARSITRVIGSVAQIQTVTLIPENFAVTIIPVPTSPFPADLEFVFFRSSSNPPSQEGLVYLGEGKVLTDTGRSPRTTYHYYVQAVTRSSAGDVLGPYSIETTDDPTDIWGVIEGEIEGQYTWTVWAVDAFGVDISLEFNPSIHKFMGLAYNKKEETPSLNPIDYTFTRIADFISPEDQTILDNLAQGKLPDGSGDLISEDDVLFKPGDKVSETHIADGSISTPKLKANAITADKLAANSVKAVNIESGQVITRHLFAESITADKMAINSVAARNIQANAITADKIAVTVVEPINNFSQSNSLRGWNHSHTPIGMVSEVSLGGAVVPTLKSMSLTSAVNHVTDRFSLDNGSVYEVRVSMYCAQTSNLAQQNLTARFFNSAGTLVSVQTLHPETLDDLGSSSAPVFWQGFVQGWRHLRGYIVTGVAEAVTAPKSANVSLLVKAPSSAVGCEISVGTLASSSSVACHFYSPSVIKVGSGSIVAETIRANAIIEAPLIKGGVLEAPEINGGTGRFTGTVYAKQLIGSQSSSVIATSSRAEGDFGVWLEFPAITSYRFGVTPLVWQTVGQVNIPQADFAQRLQLELFFDDIFDDVGMSQGQLSETITNSYSYPHQATLAVRLKRRGLTNPIFPEESSYGRSTLTMVWRPYNTGYSYRMARSAFCHMNLPATVAEGGMAAGYDIEVALRPRAGQSTPYLLIPVEEVVIRAMLSKSDGYGFSVEITR